MHPNLRKNIRRIMIDVEGFQKELEALNLDCIASARNRLQSRQQIHLMQLDSHVKLLGFNLEILLLNCFSLGLQYWKDHDVQVFEMLKRSIAIKNSLRHHILSLKTDRNANALDPDDLKPMIRDWCDLIKSVYLAHECMQFTKGLEKTLHWLT